jgi:hypothetical protein
MRIRTSWITDPRRVARFLIVNIDVSLTLSPRRTIQAA